MLFKYGLRLIYITIFFIFKNNKCIYLSSGIKSLNKFLYLSRISKYYNQTKYSTCSLNDGPNCYFTEKKYVKHFLETNNENKNIKINNEWVKLYSKIHNNNYKTILQNLSRYSSDYINSYSNKIDKAQNPEREELGIIITFDDDTTKKDMYLEKLSNVFYNERLIADFHGKLKLSDDKGEIKDKDFELFEYPSKLYGIIESEYITISFRGKLFSINYCFIRAHNDQGDSEEIQFYGYQGDKVLYGYTYTDDKKNGDKWLLVTFPEKILADKLVISGPFDIDNISFTFKYEISTDFEDLYYMYNNQKVEELIDNNDL